MGPITSIAVFLTIWWTVLFSVLPLGNRTYAEEGVEVTDGGDPGAPINPNLKKKFITTTWVSVLIFAVLFAVVTSGLVHLPPLARTH
jgi:predicted secreted protein